MAVSSEVENVGPTGYYRRGQFSQSNMSSLPTQECWSVRTDPLNAREPVKSPLRFFDMPSAEKMR